MSPDRERRRERMSPQGHLPSSQQLTARPSRPSSEQSALEIQGERSATDADQDFLSICIGQGNSCVNGSTVAAVEAQLKRVKLARCWQCGSRDHLSWNCSSNPTGTCFSCSANKPGTRPVPCSEVSNALTSMEKQRRQGGIVAMKNQLHELLRDGHRPPREGYSLVMAALADRRQPDAALAILDEMEEAGVPPDAVCYNAAIDGLCTAGRMDDAMTLVGRMQMTGCSPTAITYNTLIKGFSVARRPADAARVLNCLVQLQESHKGKVSEEGRKVIIGDSIFQGGGNNLDKDGHEGRIQATLRSYNLLLNAWCEEGDVEAARGVLRSMRLAGVAPDAVSYNTLLKAYGRQGRPEECERVLSEMVNAYVRPNERTFGMIVRSLCDAGRVMEAETVAQKMRVYDVAPNVVVYNTVMKGYSQKMMMPRRTEQVLDRMIEAGVQPDIASICTAMNAWSNAGQPDRALAVLHRGMSMGIAPDVEAFSVLAKGYLRARRPEEAEALLSTMQERHGVKPNVVAYTTVISAYCSAGGRMDDAIRVLSLMEREGVRPNAFTYRAIIWGYSEARLPKQAEEVLRRMEGGGVAADGRCYDLVAQAWQAVGMWEEGERVLDEKEERCEEGSRRVSKKEERGPRVRVYEDQGASNQRRAENGARKDGAASSATVNPAKAVQGKKLTWTSAVNGAVKEKTSQETGPSRGGKQVQTTVTSKQGVDLPEGKTGQAGSAVRRVWVRGDKEAVVAAGADGSAVSPPASKHTSSTHSTEETGRDDQQRNRDSATAALISNNESMSEESGQAKRHPGEENDASERRLGALAAPAGNGIESGSRKQGRSQESGAVSRGVKMAPVSDSNAGSDTTNTGKTKERGGSKGVARSNRWTRQVGSAPHSSRSTAPVPVPAQLETATEGAGRAGTGECEPSEVAEGRAMVQEKGSCGDSDEHASTGAAAGIVLGGGVEGEKGIDRATCVGGGALEAAAEGSGRDSNSTQAAEGSGIVDSESTQAAAECNGVEVRRLGTMGTDAICLGGDGDSGTEGLYVTAAEGKEPTNGSGSLFKAQGQLDDAVCETDGYGDADGLGSVDLLTKGGELAGDGRVGNHGQVANGQLKNNGIMNGVVNGAVNGTVNGAVSGIRFANGASKGSPSSKDSRVWRAPGSKAGGKGGKDAVATHAFAGTASLLHASNEVGGGPGSKGASERGRGYRGIAAVSGMGVAVPVARPSRMWSTSRPVLRGIGSVTHCKGILRDGRRKAIMRMHIVKAGSASQAVKNNQFRVVPTATVKAHSLLPL